MAMSEVDIRAQAILESFAGTFAKSDAAKERARLGGVEIPRVDYPIKFCFNAEVVVVVTDVGASNGDWAERMDLFTKSGVHIASRESFGDVNSYFENLPKTPECP